MGKDIIHQESPREPGRRSRLWFHEDVVEVLTENTGTSQVEGIMVKLPATDEIFLSRKCFKKMKNLKFFININARYCGKVDYYPEQLRFLYWREYPLHSLPSNFNLKKLVQLNMPFSSISNLGEGFKCLHNLKSMNFTIYQLQKLKKVDLYECQNLITLPANKANSDVNSDDEECREFNNVALPWLREFDVTRCSSLSNTDFLVSLDCASSLKRLNLSGSNIVSLSKCLSKFICVRQLYLGGCRNLVEIPQLPPHTKFLDVRDCVSLERISNLSKILEGEESQMIEAMDLSNCRRLIEELVKEANVIVNDDYQAAEALFPLFLTSQQSKFTIRFPGSEVPKWFSCQMDFKGSQLFEFCIEILENFKWENTGLALCVAVDQKLQNNSPICSFEVFIHINEVGVSRLLPQHVDSEGSDHVWLHYIPFLEMWRPAGYKHPLPPFLCRVIISQCSYSKTPLKSCGVHLVMSPNENVCMKLSRADTLTTEVSNHHYKVSYYFLTSRMKNE
ncbi:hypothetical protein M0R45_000768 [Rubus argutus]|uniref:Uncharacterized protein n=1 Tax=Rubus argutus TaxID=59490 RepID=A0AAW1VLX8_RUBAR